MKNHFAGLRLGFLALLSVLSIEAAFAVELIVLDARGGGLKTGMRIESNKQIQLKEGERVMLIGPDGKSVTLRGPFNGDALPKAAAGGDLTMALASLVATRDARTSSVGTVRAGAQASKLPDPWLIDVTRAGARCLREGQHAVWWRADSRLEEKFSVSPVDRSWQADFKWVPGEAQQVAPPLSRFESANVFLISQADGEYAININLIPNGIDNNLVLVAWMLEKGCIQQADALLSAIKVGLTRDE